MAAANRNPFARFRQGPTLDDDFRFVFEQFTSRGIPWVMVRNGGYTPASYRLVANAVRSVFEHWSEAGAP